MGILLLTFMSFRLLPLSVGIPTDELFLLADQQESAEKRIDILMIVLDSDIASNSDKFAAAIGIAKAYRRLSLPKLSLSYYRKALSMPGIEDSIIRNTTLQYADLLIQNDASEQAIVLLEQLLESENGLNDSLVRGRLAAALMSLGRYQKAAAHYRLLYDNSVPEELFPLTLNLADAYSLSGKHDAAAELVEQLKPRNNDENDTLRWEMGVLAQRAGNESEACDYFTQLAEDPNAGIVLRRQALLKLADCRLSAGDRTGALQKLAKAHQAGAEKHQTALIIVNICDEMELSEAQGLLAKWIRLSAGDETALSLLWQKRGQIALQENDFEAALDSFKRAKKLCQDERQKLWLADSIEEILLRRNSRQPNNEETLE